NVNGSIIHVVFNPVTIGDLQSDNILLISTEVEVGAEIYAPTRAVIAEVDLVIEIIVPVYSPQYSGGPHITPRPAMRELTAEIRRWKAGCNVRQLDTACQCTRIATRTGTLERDRCVGVALEGHPSNLYVPEENHARGSPIFQRIWKNIWI